MGKHIGITAKWNGAHVAFDSEHGQVIVLPYLDVIEAGEFIVVQNAESLYGVIDRSGSQVVNPEFAYVAAPFSGEFFVGYTGNGLMSVVGLDEAYRWDTDFDYIGNFDSDFAVAYNENGDGTKTYFIVNASERTSRRISGYEKVVPKVRYSRIPVKNPEGNWGYIDTTGKMRVPCKYRYAHVYSSGYAKVLEQVSDSDGADLGVEQKLIDPNGNVLGSQTFSFVFDMSENISLVSKLGTGDQFLFTAPDAKLVAIESEIIQPGEFIRMGNFSDGLADVEISGKWGFLNTIGKIAISAEYEYVSPFRLGHAFVVREGQLQVISQTGKTVSSYHEPTGQP